MDDNDNMPPWACAIWRRVCQVVAAHGDTLLDADLEVRWVEEDGLHYIEVHHPRAGEVRWFTDDEGILRSSRIIEGAILVRDELPPGAAPGRVEYVRAA